MQSAYGLQRRISKRELKADVFKGITEGLGEVGISKRELKDIDYVFAKKYVDPEESQKEN